MRFHHKLKIKKMKSFTSRLSVIVVAVVLAIASLGQILPNQSVLADQYDEKIKALESQIDGYNARAKELSEQADSLANAVAQLQNQQAQLQAEIDLNNAKRDELASQIADNEAKIKDQSSALAKTLADIYYSQQTSTLDILMNSNSVSDYVDKQTRQDSVRQQITGSVNKIKAVKAELETQKTEVERILNDQEGRKSQLVASQQKQQSLLDNTKGQEETYQNLMKDNQSQIEKLRAEQRAANAAKQGQYGGQVVAGDPGHGGYPADLDNAAQDSLVDPWGMYNRECVSYTAWKVYSTYGYMPYWGGRGNANRWLNNARSAGIPTGSTPKVGSVGVMLSGYYGHVVWVEQVSGSKVYVSQYNWDMAGHYSEMWIESAAIDGYIYFGDWQR
jgi:peptidoglycan hydrolase CwlO-like protein